MTRYILIVLFLLAGHCLSAHGQSREQNEVSINDSVKIKNTVEGFYTWYVSLIKLGRLNKDFNPTFIRDKNSMTTLDFTNYSTGLKRHGFTDDFIKRSIANYKPCLDNLKNIPYSSFDKFDDLDQFEEIKCDFSNSYEWSGGMEPIDGAELVALNKIDKHTIESTLRYFTKSSGGGKSYGGSTIFTLKLSKTGWMINDKR